MYPRVLLLTAGKWALERIMQAVHALTRTGNHPRLIEKIDWNTLRSKPINHYWVPE